MCILYTKYVDRFVTSQQKDTMLLKASFNLLYNQNQISKTHVFKLIYKDNLS